MFVSSGLTEGRLANPGLNEVVVALLQNGSLKTSVFRGVIGGIPVVMVRPADWNTCNLFRGTRIYGGSYNEMESYLYFCR